MKNNQKNIGIYVICNNYSVLVKGIDEEGEKILVSNSIKEGNNKKARWYKLYCNTKGFYFKYDSMRIYLSEIIKCTNI